MSPLLIALWTYYSYYGTISVLPQYNPVDNIWQSYAPIGHYHQLFWLYNRFVLHLQSICIVLQKLQVCQEQDEKGNIYGDTSLHYEMSATTPEPYRNSWIRSALYHYSLLFPLGNPSLSNNIWFLFLASVFTLSYDNTTTKPLYRLFLKL